MNFPLEYPVFRFFYWLINTAGVGGITAMLLGVSSISASVLTLRWIRRGAEADEMETYSFPTPALLDHDEH